ncbi:hypothetical protein [Bartonella sp. B30(2025)]
MKVVITKPMCVLGDNKSIVRFEPSVLDNPFVEVSHAVYARLKRANAARLYQEDECVASGKEQQFDEQKENTNISEQEASETAVSEKPKAVKASKPSTDFPKKA